MSTPTNIPETSMGGTDQDSYPKSKEKFQQQLQDIFQTTLKLTGPDHFDQLCQWMEYNQYLTIDDLDKIPSTTPGAEPPRDARDSGSARSHSTHLETSSSD